MPELRDRVRELLLREKLIENGDTVLAAVSGGPDSLALLHLLNTLQGEQKCPFSLHVAHLNHGLRGQDAAEDAGFVRDEALRLGLPFTAGEVDTRVFSKTQHLSLEDGARRLRYSFLLQTARQAGAASVAVGHHRDDQVETLLLNLIRGTGPDGLAGMKFKRPLGEGISLIRPLLEIGRDELERYCRSAGLSPRHDESNSNTDYTRNKIRLQLLPLLEKEYNPGLRRGLQRFSRLLQQDRDFLEAAAADGLSRLLSKQSEDYLVLDGKGLMREHAALRGRILRLAGRCLSGAVSREMSQVHVQMILALLAGSSPHGAAHLPGGLIVSRSYGNLTLELRTRPHAARFAPQCLAVPGIAVFPGSNFSLIAELVAPDRLRWPPDEKSEAYLDFEHVRLHLKEEEEKGSCPDGKPLALLVRSRLPGDRFHPFGAHGGRKLKEYLIDRKVPRNERETLPLVLAGQEIIWVAGQQISHCCRVTARTKEILVLRLERGSGSNDGK